MYCCCFQVLRYPQYWGRGCIMHALITFTGELGMSQLVIGQKLRDAVTTFCTTGRNLKEIHLVDHYKDQTNTTNACFQLQPGNFHDLAATENGRKDKSVNYPASHVTSWPATSSACGGNAASVRDSRHDSGCSSGGLSRGTATNSGDDDKHDACPICFEVAHPTKTRRLSCGHIFCEECIDRSFQMKKACPVCGAIYGKLTGNQPANGTMKDQVDRQASLPGYEGDGVITIEYRFPSGVQTVSTNIQGLRMAGTCVRVKLGFCSLKDADSKIAL